MRFSKIKLIKSYLRLTMSQQRFLNKNNHDNLIDKFVLKKH